MDVRLIAPTAPAAYKVHCSHFLHQTFGMKGEIVVQ
jgi:plastocyanin